MKTAEEHYNAKFQKEITVVSKHTVIELMESYAKEQKRETALIIADSVVLLREVLNENYNVNEKYHISPELRERISVHIIKIRK